MKYGLSPDNIRKITEVLKQIQETIIYGSRAKGTHKPASDIDLTLITLQQLNKLALMLDDLLLPQKFDIYISTIKSPTPTCSIISIA